MILNFKIKNYFMYNNTIMADILNLVSGINPDTALNAVSGLLGKNAIKNMSKILDKTAPIIGETVANNFSNFTESNIKNAGQQFVPLILDANTISVVNSLYLIRNVFSVIVITFWLINLFKDYTNLFTEESRKTVDKINNTLFGSTGAIPLLLMFWLFIIIVISLLPLLSKIDIFIGNVNNALGKLLGS